jgi:hypothetical protein
MSKQTKHLVDFFVQEGADGVGHTGKTYLAHAVSVHRDLQSWNADEEVCLGGMFHSIYGTEFFQSFKLELDRRGELRDLIGRRAESLAYWNCAMDRASFDAAVLHGTSPYRFIDRISGDDIELTQQEFDDLCTIHLCDWLEQLPRYRKWDYRREGFRRLADRLGGVARESYDRVYAQETADSPS